jgi:4-amino-4-deoxy-L-arabinose transferase-like glycosyltransferase
MTLFVILPFALMCGLWSGRLGGLRVAFLAAAIVWGGLVVVITELLSQFNDLSRLWLVACWLIAAALIVLVTRWIPHLPRRTNPQVGTMERLIIANLALFSCVLAIAAWIGPPNTFDSMTYHLPRVVHWIENRNIEFYPIDFYSAQLYPVLFFKVQQVRQLTMAPGAEFIFLNLLAIGGDERWLGLVQWFAYAGCLVAVWSAAEMLGCSSRGRALAALFAGTLPMTCLQGVSTQNDLISAFWLICFIWLTLRICAGNPNLLDWILCGISLGLALLIKATGYIFAAPIALGLIVLVVRTPHRGRQLAHLACAALLAILVNLLTYVRNYQFNHTLLGNSDNDLPYTNLPISAGHTVSNVIRNVALELSFPPGRTPKAVERVARGIHHVLGLNPDDLGSTFPFTRFDLANVGWNQEGSAPNPLHFLLLLAILIMASVGIGKPNWRVRLCLAAVVAGFAGMCLYLSWQPWHSRLHMVLFMLAAPAAGAAMERWNTRVAAAIAIVLALAAIPVIAFNAQHPLLGSNSILHLDEDSRRFIDRPELLVPYRQVADEVSRIGCRQVGIIFSGDDWEYPLEAMLRQRDRAVRIETYPEPWTLHPPTRNQGWNSNLKPFVVIRFEAGLPRIVETER